MKLWIYQFFLVDDFIKVNKMFKKFLIRNQYCDFLLQFHHWLNPQLMRNFIISFFYSKHTNSFYQKIKCFVQYMKSETNFLWWKLEQIALDIQFSRGLVSFSYNANNFEISFYAVDNFSKNSFIPPDQIKIQIWNDIFPWKLWNMENGN